jgi:hypothetical protein
MNRLRSPEILSIKVTAKASVKDAEKLGRITRIHRNMA